MLFFTIKWNESIQKSLRLSNWSEIIKRKKEERVLSHLTLNNYYQLQAVSMNLFNMLNAIVIVFRDANDWFISDNAIWNLLKFIWHMFLHFHWSEREFKDFRYQTTADCNNIRVKIINFFQPGEDDYWDSYLGIFIICITLSTKWKIVTVRVMQRTQRNTGGMLIVECFYFRSVVIRR